MPTWDEIKAGIFKGESGGDYNALFGFSNRPGGRFDDVQLTGMTVDEAIAFANPRGPYAAHVRGQVGRTATPMGAYQIVGDTLRQAKKWAGLKGDEVMTPEIQDLLGQAVLKHQGTDAWEGYRGPAAPGTTVTSTPLKHVGGAGSGPGYFQQPTTDITPAAPVEPAAPLTWMDRIKKALGGDDSDKEDDDTGSGIADFSKAISGETLKGKTADEIAGSSPGGQAWQGEDAARSQAAATLMSAILANRRRTRGVGLTSVPTGVI